MGLKFISPKLNEFLYDIFKKCHFKSREELINYLRLTIEMVNDSDDLEVSIGDFSIALCKCGHPLAIWKTRQDNIWTVFGLTL